MKRKILIENLMTDKTNDVLREIEVYCFDGKPKIFVDVKYGVKREISCYDEKFNIIDLIFHPDNNNLIINNKADNLINQTFDLSKKLANYKSVLHTGKEKGKGKIGFTFNFVRVDWLVFENKLYFNELTFSPYSGLIKFDKKWNLKIGEWIKL